MGWKIVRHSFVLLFNNLANALKVSVGPYLIAVLVAVASVMLAGVPLGMFTGGMSPQQMMMEGENFGVIVFPVTLFVLVVIMFVSSWVAVSWHRFVLLEEYPGALPALSGRPIWPYLGRVIILVIVMVLVSIPLGLVVGLISAPFMMGINAATGEPTGAFIIVALMLGIAFAAVLSWLWMRWGLSLPATAVGKPMTIGESWATTKPLSGAIFVASLIMFAISISVGFGVDAIFGAGLIGGILNLVINWISIMVGISILTTLYGHLVEGRAIT